MCYIVSYCAYYNNTNSLQTSTNVLYQAKVAVNINVPIMKADITAPVIRATDLWMTTKDAKVQYVNARVTIQFTVL